RAVPPGGSADDQRGEPRPRGGRQRGCRAGGGTEAAGGRADRCAERLVRVRGAQRGVGVPHRVTAVGLVGGVSLPVWGGAPSVVAELCAVPRTPGGLTFPVGCGGLLPCARFLAPLRA